MRSPGIVFIFLCAIAYTVLQWTYIAQHPALASVGLTYNLGSLSIICMAITIFLSTRPRPLEGLFGGLDKMYQVHKWLGIASVILFVAHFITSVAGDDDAVRQVAAGVEALELAPRDDEDGGEGVEVIGMFSMVGILLLTILTLNRKIAYHRWVKTHLLMNFFFLLVTLHVVLAFKKSNIFPFDSAPGLFICAFLALGCLSVLHRVLRPLFRKAQRFTLTELHHLHRATELVLTPEQEALSFEPGQFAFIKIKRKGFAEYHPFTISSGAQDKQLRFTLKVLGDYTRRVRDQLQPGAQVLVDGPYGRFSPLREERNQIWIAGGIGITPFLSALRSLNQAPKFSIDLFYCVRDASSALFVDEIHQLVSTTDQIRVHLFSSQDGQRLSVDALLHRAKHPLERYAYYYCGPKQLIDALRPGLAEKRVRASQIHLEAFEIR